MLPRACHSFLTSTCSPTWSSLGVPVVAQWKRIWLGSMRTQVPYLPLLSWIRIWRCHDLWCRRGSDLAWLWLWLWPAAVAPIWPLAWEPPYAEGVALERPKKRKKWVCLKVMGDCVSIAPFFYLWIMTLIFKNIRKDLGVSFLPAPPSSHRTVSPAIKWH